MKRISRIIALTMLMFGGLVIWAAPASALNPLENACNNTGGAADNTICQNQSSNTVGDLIKTIINVLLYIIGAIAVIMIIIGGIQFVVSTGDAGQVTKAKNTILYSVIGLAIAIFAYAIVNFVIREFQ